MASPKRTLKRLAARPYKVIQRGTDSSGRPVYANARMWAAFDKACGLLGAVPTITQGAYMLKNGGGADASAGYHDKGGCIDMRVWDLESKGTSVAKVVAAFREVGWAAWLRDPSHGGFSDPHIHAVLLGDAKAAPGAKYQMTSYKSSGDGMGGTDYHPRPKPIPTFNYRKWLKEQEMSEDRIIAAVKAEGQKTRDVVNARAKAELARDGRIEARMKARTDAVQKLISDLPPDRQARILNEVKALRTDLANEGA